MKSITFLHNLVSVASSFAPAAPHTTFVPPTIAYLTMVDIVYTAAAAGFFSTLAAALVAAGLIDTLKGPGPFTIFTLPTCG